MFNRKGLYSHTYMLDAAIWPDMGAELSNGDLHVYVFWFLKTGQSLGVGEWVTIKKKDRKDWYYVG